MDVRAALQVHRPDRTMRRPSYARAVAGWPTSTGVPIAITWQGRPQWTDIQINLFERCPRRFFYTHVLRLGGRRTETAFMKMHNVVSDVFEWLKREHETTVPVDVLAPLRGGMALQGRDRAWIC
jgi:hypothetical protein